jgi:hypothetical protein
MIMLNSPLPPDVDVTQRLQTVISEWKGAQAGHKLERLYQDCVDLVGQDRQARKLLIDELQEKFVALDALAKALDVPDVDHYDLLRHVLFQQPMLSREERVRRLRSQHSTFFQRFEHNLLANELLNVILDKYSRGEAPDVSDLDLLGVQPLKVRTQKEWLQAFRQGPTQENLPAVLKELQQLLYSV